VIILNFLFIFSALIFISGFTNARPAERPAVLLDALEDARSVRASTLGNLFVVETGKNRILKLNHEGVRRDSIGRLGSGDYQFDTPVAIDPTNELKIYVADRDNRRIQVFDRRLQYLSTVGLPRRAGLGSSYRPVLISADPIGRFYFYDDERNVVYRFDSNGQYDLDFDLFSEEERIRPVSMAVIDEELWVAGRRGELLHRFSSGGSYLGFIYTPEPVTSIRSRRGELWMLGTEHVFRLDGTGDVMKSIGLPEARGRGQNWRSFELLAGHVYLLSSQSLVRIPMEQ